jgi:predicted transcriptional regulator
VHIDKNDKLADIPILSIRKILSKNRDGIASDDFYIDLGVSKKKAMEILKLLKLRGLIQEKADRFGKFELTELGHQFSIASSLKQITREKAEVKLAMFLDRVKEVNDSSYYLYSVGTGDIVKCCV